MIASPWVDGSAASPTGSWLAVRQSWAVTRPTSAAASATAPATRIKVTMPTRRLIDVSLPVLQIERDGFISFNGAERRGLTPREATAGNIPLFGVLVERLVAVARRSSGRAHRGEIEELAVHEMGRHEIGKGAEHRVHPPGVALFPLAQHLLHLLPLQRGLRAAQVAGDDREFPRFGIGLEVGLRHVSEGADHDVLSVVG